jgi:hypothetical protein
MHTKTTKNDSDPNNADSDSMTEFECHPNTSGTLQLLWRCLNTSTMTPVLHFVH